MAIGKAAPVEAGKYVESGESLAYCHLRASDVSCMHVGDCVVGGFILSLSGADPCRDRGDRRP